MLSNLQRVVLKGSDKYAGRTDQLRVIEKLSFDLEILIVNYY